jgi:hypothetical protein
MSGTAIAAIVAFAVLFMAWVVLPTILKKRHTQNVGTDLEVEE